MNISIIPKTLGAVILTVGVMAGFDLGLTDSGRQLVATYLNVPAVAPVHPSVLVVAANKTDQQSVSTTVEPRGYEVLVATNTKSGLRLLQESSNRVQIVVVDTSLPNTAPLLRRLRASYPEVRIITVDRNHSAVVLARKILNAI